MTESAAALRARYGEAAPATIPWNPALELLLSHRSVRAYRPDPLPEGTLEALVAAAQSAATSSNMQAWSVVAVTDPDSKRRLAAVAGGQRHVEQCPLFLVFLADLSRHARLAERTGRPLEGLPFLETFLVAALDAGLAAHRTPWSRRNPWASARSISAPCATIWRRWRRNSACRPAPRRFSAFASVIPRRMAGR